ncbi:stearoyl-CoA 9-desaturase [Basidiobolus ranarum]|uniref:Acyl-CoA desaturase n=1 Tax=Basidiobolus ranarum TaxID=34480 RepID=A0ABR2WZG3_9FUNG
MGADIEAKLPSDSSMSWDELPLVKKLNWTHTIFVVFTPLISLYGIWTTPIQKPTLIWSVIYYFVTGLGITGGYHRLWAHKAYSATVPLQIILALAGGGAVQGSIKWWARGHRAHHRHTDTEKDPYSAHKGLFYSHIGWIMMNPEPGKIGYADTSDLNSDPIVRFQHKYFLLIALIMGFIFPVVIAGVGWGDWRGGFYFAAVARLVFVHHATFCVNSLAHYLGEHSFDDKHTPRDHFVTAFVTLGEGYHNFHHQFPQDYRNAIRFYQYDPTKWFIHTCSLFGLSYNLKRFPQNEITKGQLQMQEKKIEAAKKTLRWGEPLDQLPVYTVKEVEKICHEENRKWIIINNVVHDVSSFIDDHPGGKALISSAIGKDGTVAFTGGVYDHSNGAKNLVTTMRVGVIKPVQEDSFS